MPRNVVLSDFPPTMQSIWGDEEDTNKYKSVVWLRPHEMSKVTRPRLITGKMRASDPKQGQLGNCGLISAIFVAAEYMWHWWDLVYDGNRSEPENGKYCFTFCDMNEKQSVVIDDLIPCDGTTKRPLFATSTDPDEMWVSLLEKALAAYFGSYKGTRSWIF